MRKQTINRLHRRTGRTHRGPATFYRAFDDGRYEGFGGRIYTADEIPGIEDAPCFTLDIGEPAIEAGDEPYNERTYGVSSRNTSRIP